MGGKGEKSPSGEIDWQTPVTLEYNGVRHTLPLVDWLGFCQEPEDQRDPNKMDEVARKILAGGNPFSKNFWK